jgi:hypothetical protein
MAADWQAREKHCSYREFEPASAWREDIDI